MGMWDKLLMEPEKPKLTGGDIAMAMIPFYGPFHIFRKGTKGTQAGIEKWMKENAAYNDTPPTHPAVRERMLTRTGGEQTVQGLKAATAAKRAALDPGNMGNMGNILMETASKLAASGDTQSALTLGQLAHKQFQTPWKPEEGGRKVMNFRMPDDTIKTATGPKEAEELVKNGGILAGVASAEGEGEWNPMMGTELGLRGQAAGNAYWVKRNKKGGIKDVKTADNMTISVGGPDLGIFGEKEVAEKIELFQSGLRNYKNTRTIIGELKDLIRPGTTGWGGAVSRLGDKLVGLQEFIGGLNKRNDRGEAEAAVVARYMNDPRLKGLVSKIAADGVDSSRAMAYAVKVAYDIARANNSTESGGRGITDADMEFAMQQLGMGGSPESFRAVLSDYSRRVEREFKDKARLDWANLTYKNPNDERLRETKRFMDEVFNAPPEALTTDRPLTPEEVEELLNAQ